LLQVWKREQKQAAEQKKLEELRKQYEEDRKNQEMTQIAEAAGYRSVLQLSNPLSHSCSCTQNHTSFVLRHLVSSTIHAGKLTGLTGCMLGG
jgi:hypothetical protein